MIMKACENHEMSVVVFSEDTCPLCNAEKALKTIWAEIEKSMGILEELRRVADEAGLKKKYKGQSTL
jgi:protein-disulfide isomerase